MSPSFTAFDVGDEGGSNRKQLCKIYARTRRFSDCTNLVLGELRVAVLFTRTIGSVKGSIPAICRARIPAKVQQTVVQLISIVVATIQILRSRPSKCSEDQDMDVMTCLLAFLTQAHQEIPPGSGGLLQDFALVQVDRTIGVFDSPIHAANVA